VEAPYKTEHPEAGANGEGYIALINLATENLWVGNSVVIDTVNPVHWSRTKFVRLAKETGAQLIQFELKIKDKEIHKQRVEKRMSDIHGLKVPTWQEVQEREYEKWDEDIDGPATVLWMDDGEDGFQKAIGLICGKA
jgi:predicted kinase